MLDWLLEYERKAGFPPRPTPRMTDARWHRDGPRIYDRVRLHPSAYWQMCFRGGLRGDIERWSGLVGLVVEENPFGPFVGVLVDRYPSGRRRPARSWHPRYYHADELELLALRVPDRPEWSLPLPHWPLRVVK